MRVILRPVAAPGQPQVCIEPLIRLRATNIGSSDLRLALVAEGLSATDDLGISVLASDRHQNVYPTVVGITRVGTLNDWTTASTSGTSRIMLLAPGQSVGVELTPSEHKPKSMHCQQDPSGDFRRSYRPQTVTLTATLGVVDISGNGELRTFSLFDIPVDLVRN